MLGVKSVGTSTVVVEKSRFIGILQPAQAAPAQETIAAVKQRYPGASHYCYALRTAAGAERAEDDGEPSGSAGLPLLGLLRVFELFDALLIVVRYFGGHKLGKGRLTRTYRAAGAHAVEAAEIAEPDPLVHVAVALPHQRYPVFRQWLRQRPHRHLSESFDAEGARWEGWLRLQDWELVAARFEPANAKCLQEHRGWLS